MNLLVPILGRNAGNLGYLTIGVAFLLPTILILIRSNYFKWKLLLTSVLLLRGALFFGALTILPQTHFQIYCLRKPTFVAYFQCAIGIQFRVLYFFLNEFEQTDTLNP